MDMTWGTDQKFVSGEGAQRETRFKVEYFSNMERR
jgi:hypothetical protein